MFANVWLFPHLREAWISLEGVDGAEMCLVGPYYPLSWGLRLPVAREHVPWAWIFQELTHNRLILIWGWAKVLSTDPIVHILNMSDWQQIFSLFLLCVSLVMDNECEKAFSHLSCDHTDENETVKRGPPDLSHRSMDLRLYTRTARTTREAASVNH